MRLREKLRAATRAEHDSLEAYLALDDPHVGRDEYLAYIERLLPFYRGVAPRLAVGRSLWPGTADCETRIRWLEEDVRFFGRAPPEDVVPGELVPAARDIPELAGISYVVEGAALGARVLYTRFHAGWGLEHGGASFLWGYGAEAGTRWRDFVAELNALVLDAHDETRCLAAARQTFGGLHAWFTHSKWRCSARYASYERCRT